MNSNNKKGMNSLTAAVVGAAVGAAAVALSKKENRDKLKQKADELLSKGGKSLKHAQDKVEKAKEESKMKLADTLEKASSNIKKDRTTTVR